MVTLVAFGHVPVCQHDLCAEQVVEGEAVAAPEDSVASAEGDATDADRRAGAAWHGDAVGQEALVHFAQARACATPLAATTECMGVTSMTMPVVEEYPAKL